MANSFIEYLARFIANTPKNGPASQSNKKLLSRVSVFNAKSLLMSKPSWLAMTIPI